MIWLQAAGSGGQVEQRALQSRCFANFDAVEWRQNRSFLIFCQQTLDFATPLGIDKSPDVRFWELRHFEQAARMGAKQTKFELTHYPTKDFQCAPSSSTLS
ncbi:MAG TPA: hypothetical protein VIE66_10770 [Methylocella sp.]